MTRVGFIGIATVAAVVSIASAAQAQTPQPPPRAAQGQPPPAPPARDKWRLTFRAGGSIPNAPSTGLSALPPVGLPDNLLPGTADRSVPSWFFGDGATILNANLPPGARPITPLDAVLTSAALARSTGPVFGLSISRAVGSRYRLEFSIDGARSGPAFTSSARGAIEASRASFADAFGSLFAVFPTSSASSTATVSDGQRLEWMVSGAVDVTLRATPRNEWHATAGVGFVSDAGTGPTAALDGHNGFTIGTLAFAEEDRVTLTSIRDQRPFLLLGGGWAHNLSRRWGLSADLRVALSGPGETTQVATNPAFTLHSPPDVPTIVTGRGAPTIVFANFNGGSSLGPPLATFTSFVATGVQVRAELTAGLFLRF